VVCQNQNLASGLNLWLCTAFYGICGYVNCLLQYHFPTIFYSMSFQIVPSFSIPLSFSRKHESSTVCGHSARTVFDCQSPVSTVSPSFGRRFRFRRFKSSIPVSVVTTTGAFSCLVNLTEEPVDTFYDLKLGRDWFSYCTTSIPDAYLLLSDDTGITFSSSPFSAVRPRQISEFLFSFSSLNR
jgi:hypothetical protein